MRCSMSHTRNAEVSRWCHHTTNLVDVNWTVTVINVLQLPSKLLMIPRILPPVHRRGRGPPWRMDANFRR